MQTSVTLAAQEDAPELVDWITSTPNNMLDPGIANYPSLRTLKVSVGDKSSMYMPFHPVFCVESLAHRPDIKPRENAYALRKAQDVLEQMARSYGISEILWMCKDESLIQFAGRHGYEVLTCHVLRKKVAA